jgi:hypothetical protein
MTHIFSGGPVRMFRLTDEPGGLGLSCTPDGVSLAGVPLLRKTQAGFVPRPAAEIALLLKAAYGGNPMPLQFRLGAITQALNSGDFAGAMIAAVQTETPELSPDAAAQLRRAEEALTKYNYDPQEPRDWHGRWTRDGSTEPASATAPTIETAKPGAVAHDRPVRIAENTFPPGGAISSDAPAPSDRNPFSPPTQSGDFSERAALLRSFEQKYDDLGPADFSDQAIRFGYWLGAHGREFSPAEKERALAEYAFLQNRLLAWQRYEYKSPREGGYITSAASRLFQGAINGGLVSARDLPPSILDVAGTVALLENSSPTRPLPGRRPRVEEPPPARFKPIANVELGAIVDREIAGIIWGKSIQEQGIGKGNTGWEIYVASQDPNNKLLRPNATGFDVFNWTKGEAISAKTLDTKTMTYIRNPREIYRTVKGYVDDILDYERYWDTDVMPHLIKSKTLQLAVPVQTSPEQWRNVLRAVIYGKDNGVRIVITRIRG